MPHHLMGGLSPGHDLRWGILSESLLLISPGLLRLPLLLCPAVPLPSPGRGFACLPPQSVQLWPPQVCRFSHRHIPSDTTPLRRRRDGSSIPLSPFSIR